MVTDDPMQLADCNNATVVLYNNEIRYKLSPAFTVYAHIHDEGGPHGITVTVGTGGTYKMEPVAGTVLFKQLLIFKLSTVVLYRSAIEYNVSLVPTVMGIHPPGIEHAAATCKVFVTTNGVGDGMAVGVFWVGIGDANSTANVVGVSGNVGVWDGGDDSANASEMPPITRIRDIAPMINPLPIWRRAFMINSLPPACPWRWEAIR
jgi:hypothetical protein